MQVGVRQAGVWTIAIALAATADCGVRRDQPMTTSESEAVIREVRAFGEDVARDVTKDGPAAWAKYFADAPGFFMAVDGKLEFVNGMAAQTALPQIVRAMPHIELHWGEGMRVDALAPGLAMLAAPYHEVRVDAAGKRTEEEGYFTGLAEQRDGRWQLRNAHWSSRR